MLPFLYTQHATSSFMSNKKFTAPFLFLFSWLFFIHFTQNRPFYDYVHSGGGSMTNLHVTSTYPNYYGSPSPNQKYLGQCRSAETRRIPGYNNYGYHTEMREVNNSYTIPQVCIEDADVRPFFLFFVNLACFFCLPLAELANFKRSKWKLRTKLNFFVTRIEGTICDGNFETNWKNWWNICDRKIPKYCEKLWKKWENICNF